MKFGMAFVWAFLCAFQVMHNSASTNRFIDGNIEFAFDLHRQLAKEDQNLVYSPLTVTTALAMCEAGARGKTREEIRKAARFGSSSGMLQEQFKELSSRMNALRNSEANVLLRNAIWVRPETTVLPGYIAGLQQNFQSHFGLADFTRPEAAAKVMNEWISAQTRGRIPNAVGPSSISPEYTRLFLASVFYFKAPWVNPFTERATRNEPFNAATGQKVDTPFMHQEDDFRYFEDSNVQVLELPYQNPTSMIVLLPKARKTLQTIEARLNGKTWENWFTRLKSQEVQVALPKFKLQPPEIDLQPPLKQMGIKHAFTDKADFAGISDDKPLFIGHASHAAFIEVDEKGTEAAAATIFGNQTLGIAEPRKPKVFRADRPFLFAIVDRQTKSILLLGRFVGPPRN